MGLFYSSAEKTGTTSGRHQQGAAMISLVMATVGRTEEIRRLVDSLVDQTEKRFELIAVDQNGDDRLVPILNDAAALGLIVKHIRLDKPNLSIARNIGIEAASHPIVGFPDDDCWYDSCCLEGVCRAFSDYSELGACIALWEERDKGSELISTHFLDWNVVSAFRSVPISSITLFVKRDQVRMIGGFDSRLGVGRWYGGGEETDLVMSLVRDANKVVFSPSAKVHHAVNAQSEIITASHRQAKRRRARGTGALYAKHQLRIYVILRGFLMPAIKGLFSNRRSLNSFLTGCAISLGRLEGYFKWQVYESLDRSGY